MIQKISELYQRTKKAFFVAKNKKKDVVYLSFGENCLTDNILKRHYIKSFSTPYSSGRSNVEYLLQIEKDMFKDFLNTKYMNYDFVNDRKVVRLNIYREISNEYHSLSMNGFEFTYHDVLGDPTMQETMARRSTRLLTLKGKKICIFYHNRYGGNTDEAMLIKHLQELRAIYTQRGCKAHVFLFKQNIVSSTNERRAERKELEGLNAYTFHTLNPWAGTDLDIFWARCDDDLIKTMISDAKTIWKKR